MKIDVTDEEKKQGIALRNLLENFADRHQIPDEVLAQMCLANTIAYALNEDWSRETFIAMVGSAFDQLQSIAEALGPVGLTELLLPTEPSDSN